jgi:hypothetical protein
MSSIETTFTFGTEVTFESLTIVPLLGTPSSGPDYDTLDAALARGTLHITEVSESGQVPEIKVLNEGQLPVLIIDGEELVGAKQNRTVNLSILVPPTANVIVPVTCVEAGRWSLKSRSFSSSSHTHFAAGRAAKSSQVSESLLRHGIARADQSQVWRDIEKKSARLQAHSATSAMSEIFERQGTAIEDFVRGLPVVEDQVGAVFFLNGEPMGVDLLDSPRTFRLLMPKILRGYALDAIDRRSNPLPHDSSSTSRPTMKTRAEEFMRQVLDAPRTQFAAPGLGETWRLFAPQVSGGGLTAGGKLLHMSAFRA